MPFYTIHKPVIQIPSALTAAAINAAIAAAAPGDVVDIPIPTAQTDIFLGSTPLLISKSVTLRGRAEADIKFPQVRFYGGSQVTGTWTSVTATTYKITFANVAAVYGLWCVGEKARWATNVGALTDNAPAPLGEYIAWSVNEATTAALLDAKANGAWSFNGTTLYLKAPSWVTNAAAWNSADPGNANAVILAVEAENVLKFQPGAIDVELLGIEFSGARYSSVDLAVLGESTDAYLRNLRLSNCGFHGGYDIKAGVAGTSVMNGLRINGGANVELYGCSAHLNGNDGFSIKGPAKVYMKGCTAARNRDDGASPHDGSFLEADGCNFSENGWNYTALGISNTSAGGVQVVQGAKGVFRNCQFNRNGQNGAWVANNARDGSWASFENCMAGFNGLNGFDVDGSDVILTRCTAIGHADATQGRGFRLAATNPTNGFRPQASLIDCVSAQNRQGLTVAGIDTMVSCIKYFNNTANESVGTRSPVAPAFTDGVEYTLRAA
jgi:hypothetical protein